MSQQGAISRSQGGSSSRQAKARTRRKPTPRTTAGAGAASGSSSSRPSTTRSSKSGAVAPSPQPQRTTKRTSSASRTSPASSTKRNGTASATPNTPPSHTAVLAPPSRTTVLGSRRGPTRRGDGLVWRPSRGGVKLLVVLGVLLAAYLVGLFHFSNRFLPGTTVAGMDASGLTVDEFAELVDQRVATYEDHVSGQGLDFTVHGSDIGLSCDSHAFAKAAIAQSGAAGWPVGIFGSRTVDADMGVSYDEALLGKQVIDAMSSLEADATVPEGMTYAYDPARGRYVTANEIVGSEEFGRTVYGIVSSDVSALATDTVISDDVLAKAGNDKAQDVPSAVRQANAMLALSFPLTFEGREVARADSDLISGWIYILEEDGDTNVYVDREAIYLWSYYNLNNLVNGEDATSTWEVNSPAVATAVAEELESLSEEPVEIPTIIDEGPEESEGARERGRHIDVNLTTQYARLYDWDGNILWGSYVVTGTPDGKHDTPTGEFEIESMETDITMVGADENEDGEPDYETPVKYWIGFTLYDGFHDADWHSEYGGYVYQWEGSHGCVNLSLEKAAQLYDLCYIGDAVYIHD